MTTSLVHRPLVVPAPGTYRIDPARSRIEFTTRHLFGLGAVRGSFDLEDGEIRVADKVERSRALAAVAAGTVATGHPARDRAVRSARLLDTDAHPHLTFCSERLVMDGEPPRLLGELVVHGVTRQVAVTIEEAECVGAELRVRAGTRIDRYAFGVTGYRGIAARHLDIRLDLLAVRG